MGGGPAPSMPGECASSEAAFPARSQLGTPPLAPSRSGGYQPAPAAVRGAAAAAVSPEPSLAAEALPHHGLSRHGNGHAVGASPSAASLPPLSRPPLSRPSASSTAPPSPPRRRVIDAEVESTWEALLTSVVAEEAPPLVRASVRALVSQLAPARRPGGSSGGGGVYGEVFSAVLTDVLSTEAKSVVGEAIEAVADDYVQRRGAERVVEILVEEVLRDELPPLAAEARVAVIAERLLDDAMAPVAREIAVATLYEARGAAARKREAEERAQVATRAAEGLFERLCLQRLLQHVATNGEVLLLQREAAQLLDKLVAEGLARRALAIGQGHSDLQASAVMRAAHERLAYGALVDEMLAQLRALAASGLEAGVPRMAEETDTDGDDAP